MRIGQFSDSFLPIVDGVGRVAYEYCRLLSKNNDVSIICPMNDMGNRGQYDFEIIDYYSKRLLVNKQYELGLTVDPHYRRLLDMKQFDIVHVHTPFIAGIEGVIYGKQHHVPIVGTFHSKYYDDFLQITRSKHLAEFGTDAIVEFYNQCDEVWTVSKYAAKTLKSYGYKGKIQVVSNGINISRITNKQVLLAKKQFNIDTKKPTLLYVGQINWKKNIELIIKACSLLSKNNIDYNLLLVGQGPHEKDVVSKCKQLDIIGNTIFTGPIKNQELLNGLYSLADLFVFPSDYDTYSMVVREAAVASTASVVLKNSAPSEPIIDGVNGFICNNNANSLFNVLKNNILDRDKLRTIGLEAKNTIPVSWDLIIKDVEDRYKKLISNH